MAPRRVTIGSLGEELDRAGGFASGGGSGSGRRARAGRRSSTGRMGVGRVLLAVGGVALCLFVAGSVAVHLSVDPDEVGRWIGPRASAALGRDVTVGGAGIALIPRPALRIDDVRVDNLGGFEGPALATMDHIRLELALLPLLTGRVRFSRARVEGTRVHLAVDVTGASSFGDLVPAGGLSLPETAAPVSFDLREISFTDAGLTFFDAPRERSFAVAGTAGTLRLGTDGGGGWSVEGSGASDSLHVRVPRLTEEILRTSGPRFTLLAGGDATLHEIEIESLVIEQAGETLSVRGGLAGLTTPDPTIDVRLGNPRMSASVVGAFVPTAVKSRTLPRTDGTLDVALRLRGPLGGSVGPELSGTVGLDDFALRLNGEPLVADVAGVVDLDADTLTVDSLAGSFAGGPFELSGSLITSRRDMIAKLTASPDLDALDRLGLVAEGATLAGEARLALTAAGSFREVDSITVDGTMRLTGVQLEHPRAEVPVYLPAAEVRVAGSELFWEDLTVLLGEEPLSTTGRLGGVVGSWLGRGVPVVQATVTAERLTVGHDSIRDRAASDATYAQIAFAHLGSREISGRRASNVASAAGLRRPAALPLHGTVDLEVGALVHHDRELRSVTARVQLVESMVAVRDASFEIWGGSVRGSLELGVGERLDEPFSLALDGEGLGATAFLSALTPLGDAVTGELALHMVLTGTTDPMLLPLLATLEGNGTVTLSEGSIAGTGLNFALADFLASEEWGRIPFTTWTTELAVGEEMVQVDDAELLGALGRASASGAIGLGGAVDLAVGLSIPPERLRGVSLRRTGVAQSVLDHLRSTGSPLDLGIRVSGSLQGPTLEPDALAAGVPARSARR